MKVQVLIVAMLAVNVLTGGCSINRNSPVYKQCDSSWGGNSLGSSSTICKVGCLMTSVSSALASLGKTINGQTSTPATLNAWLKSNGGYSGNLFSWGSVSRLGLTYESKYSDQNTIRNAICANKVVILNVKYGGHWVLATGYSDSTYYVMDPGYTKSSYPAAEVTQAAVFRF